MNKMSLAKAIVALLLAMIFPASAQPLRFVVSTSYSMPYGKYESEKLVGGLIFDLGTELAKSLGMTLEFIELPRKRIDDASLSGKVDVRCHTNPKWSSIAEQFVWSDPLFEMSDIVFAGEANPPLANLSDITSPTIISAVLGYSYPGLDAAFAAGRLKREDTFDQDKVMLKVSAGRTPYGVSNNLALDWYRRTTPMHRLADWQLVIEKVGFYCAVPKASPLPPDRILKALAKMKKSGRIEALRRNYR